MIMIIIIMKNLKRLWVWLILFI